MISEYLTALCGSVYGRQVVCRRVLEGREAEFAEVRRPWPQAVHGILDARGLTGLYTHQALAADCIRAGRNVVVSTPTASGKTLLYSLPIVERLLADPDARALWLFPLKALARDQLGAFERLTAHWPKQARPTAAIYDGDTTEYARRKLRLTPPQVLISNPEMVHLSLLPYHEKWAEFFAGLAFVVVDEAHTWRGVTGSHIAQVLRRLARISARYGSQPVYVFCTATVGNPRELAINLLGGEQGDAVQGSHKPLEHETPAPCRMQAANPEVHVIDRNGAPAGQRHVVFIDPEKGPSAAAIDLLRAALARGLRTIVYCRSRRQTETLALWATDGSHPWKQRISAYRAGFLPEERRDIEARMASGELLAVISTSALELGIDIGSLDVCILVGYPGTVMSTLQRGGRVGRAGQDSAVLLLGGEDALDQYFMRNPNAFFERGAEIAVVNPDNEVILERHLMCAAAESPLRLEPPEPWVQRPAVAQCIAAMCARGHLLLSADGREVLGTRKRPQHEVSLRGCGASYTIVDDADAAIGSMDEHQAFHEAHPGALYLHKGKSYLIANLDHGSRKAHAVPLGRRPDWFTRVRSNKMTEILDVYATRQVFGISAALGRLRVTETLTGYETRRLAGNRLQSVTPFSASEMPPLVFETEGVWFIIPDTIRREMEDAFLHFMGGIHALEHVCIGLLPLEVMADRNDFGGISTPMHPQLGASAVFVYDGLPGGAGLVRAAFPQLEGLFAAVREVLHSCPCDDGCPSCVHSPKCGSGNRPLSKHAALALVSRIMAGLKPGEQLQNMPAIAPANERALALAAASSSKSLLFAPNTHYVVVDVETRRSADEVGGWNRADRMGVSVAVLYDSAEDAFIPYEQDALSAMFARMREADVVVGFNILRFDYAVLQPFATYDLHSLPTVDLLKDVHAVLSYRVALDNLASATLGSSKSADGLLALRWWREGKIDQIAEYCRKDVALTRDLYVQAREKGYLLFTNKAGQAVRVTFVRDFC